MVKIKENRDEYLEVFNSHEDDRQRLEKLKMDKIESDSLSNRQLISGFEKKLEADSDYRNKS
jgi:hypothetical protein